MCLLNHFSCTKFNYLRWPDFYVISMNIKFNVLASCWKFKKNTDNTTKYKMHVPNTWGRKKLIIPHFTSIWWTHPLRSNQSLRNFLCFSSRCKGDLIKSYPWSKKNLIKFWENIIAYLEESEWSEALANNFSPFQKTAGGFMVVAAV